MMMMIRGSYGQEFSVLFSWLTVYTSYWLAAAIPGRLVLGRFSTRVFQCGRSQWSVYGANKPAGGIVWRRSPTSAWVTSSRATTFGSPTRSGRRRSRRPRRCRTKNRLSPAGYGQPPIVPRCIDFYSSCWCGVVTQWYGVGLAITRSRVRSPATARLRNDSGQVVHTKLPRRWHSSLVYRFVKLGTFFAVWPTFWLGV